MAMVVLFGELELGVGDVLLPQLDDTRKRSGEDRFGGCGMISGRGC
jgi:hypothetical protein